MELQETSKDDMYCVNEISLGKIDLNNNYFPGILVDSSPVNVNQKPYSKIAQCESTYECKITS